MSFIIPVEGTTNEFVIGSQLDIRHFIWDGEKDSTPTSSILYSALQDSDGSKFNDAKVDWSGFLWAGEHAIPCKLFHWDNEMYSLIFYPIIGTMGPTTADMQFTERNGKLYRVSPSTGIKTYVEDILLSNGMAWSADGSIMYYTDSFDGTVDSFDYDASAEPPISELIISSTLSVSVM